VLPGIGKKLLLFIGLLVTSPLICIGECINLYTRMRADVAARKAEKKLKISVQEATRYNYGASMSLRESVAASIYGHFFEKSERDLYQKALDQQMFDTIIDLLDARNVDTSALREQRTYMINSGLIVHGNVQAGALAVGEASQAKSALRGAEADQFPSTAA
jgi:hypothetical protein